MNTLSNCNPVLLRKAIDGTLNAKRQSEVELHLDGCPLCRKNLEQLAAEAQDWAKVSDYFLPDNWETDPLVCQPTVAIQVARGGLASFQYEIADESSSRPATHQALSPASHPEMLGRIDSFEIEQVIGQGGMGIVYKGFDTELNRPVAIKVLADHLAANGVARQRFAREARAAAAVIHPNVVPIYSVNSSADRPFLVMSLVAGRSLQAHVSQQGQLPVREVVRIGKQIASGLSAAHREGLVHRDIKPANILLEKDVSRVMITDFGLARAADDAAITQTGWLAGTPHYMSPEQASGREIDQRSDLFSLGSVLYFMATGREPFRAEIPVAVLQKITSDEAEPVRSVNSEISSTLAKLIDKLMSKKPGDRFETAEDVEIVLTQYLAHLEQPRTQPKPKIKLARKKIQTATWSMAGLSLLVLIGIAWFAQSPSPSPSEPIAPHWPSGLQSPVQWEANLNELENAIEQLERDIEQPHRPTYWDPIGSETQSLESNIRQLESVLDTNR